MSTTQSVSRAAGTQTYASEANAAGQSAAERARAVYASVPNDVGQTRRTTPSALDVPPNSGSDASLHAALQNAMPAAPTVPTGTYTLDDVVRDMQAVQNHDRRETGPKRSAAYLRQIGKAIIAGVKQNFPTSRYGSQKEMARTLIASAWKESKFGTNAPNGGIFQCAQNRLNDYNRAHGTNISHQQLSTNGDPSLSIKVSLWAMAHPAKSVLNRAVGGAPIPTKAREAALYYWNYNPREIADYMSKTRYFRSLTGQGSR